MRYCNIQIGESLNVKCTKYMKSLKLLFDSFSRLMYQTLLTRSLWNVRFHPFSIQLIHDGHGDGTLRNGIRIGQLVLYDYQWTNPARLKVVESD